MLRSNFVIRDERQLRVMAGVDRDETSFNRDDGNSTHNY